MIRHNCISQKQPAAPFVRVSLQHPQTGAELQNLPAQIDTGADQTLVPFSIAAKSGLHQTGEVAVVGVGGNDEQMPLFEIILKVHSYPPQRMEVLSHPQEPWILLGRDLPNSFRLVLDGPNPVLELF